jgi:hypothetical protein
VNFDISSHFFRVPCSVSRFSNSTNHPNYQFRSPDSFYPCAVDPAPCAVFLKPLGKQGFVAKLNYCAVIELEIVTFAKYYVVACPEISAVRAIFCGSAGQAAALN